MSFRWYPDEELRDPLFSFSLSFESFLDDEEDSEEKLEEEWWLARPLAADDELEEPPGPLFELEATFDEEEEDEVMISFL